MTEVIDSRVVTSVDEYADAFTAGRAVEVSSLCGRILRGRTPEDFTTLTDDPKRKVVMLMGPDGLQMLPGKSGYEMLTTIGYTPQHIARKVHEGNSFKLVVFPEGADAQLATWPNMLAVVGQVYPEMATNLRANQTALETTSFQEIQTSAGYDFADVDVAGVEDPRFMTRDRYLASNMGPLATRAFLYHTVHLRELYSGDGYTYTPDGERGLQEYVIRNERLDALGDYALLDVPVEL